MTLVFDYRKLQELILYIASRAENIGAVKLEKLLYLCDFTAYDRLGTSITGEVYRHFKNGPIAKHLKPVVFDMENDKKSISVTSEELAAGISFTRFKPKRESDLSVFSKEELAIADEILKEFGRWTAKQLIKYVHDDWTWKLTDENKEIPYYLAPYRRHAKPDDTEIAELVARKEYQDVLAKTLVSA
jgi:hypothetical protein